MLEKQLKQSSVRGGGRGRGQVKVGYMKRLDRVDEDISLSC